MLIRTFCGVVQAREGASVALVGLGADAVKKMVQAICAANKYLGEDGISLSGNCVDIALAWLVRRTRAHTSARCVRGIAPNVGPVEAVCACQCLWTDFVAECGCVCCLRMCAT